MGKVAPNPGNYSGAAEKESKASQQAANWQTSANRPDISTPYAYQKWTQDPTSGEWAMQTGYNGALGDTSNALQKQAAANMAQPFDWGQFGDVPQFGDIGSGEAARQQAIDAAYGQASSRLDPQWQQREDAMRTRLLNQGLTEGSEAYNQQMGTLGRERNDAYTSAMNSAIGQGTSAGDSVFRNNLSGAQARFSGDMAARQTALAEALRARGMPMEEMGSMQSLLALPGFNGGGGYQSPQYLNAAIAQDGANLGWWQARNKADSEMFNQAMNLVGTIGSMAMSDERVKANVERLSEEALPGVPVATFEYAAEPGVRYRGVIAQDVAAERPDLVAEGPDGLLRVHPSLAPERL
ncbi:tail fiber domain-containing protein [Corallococcus sp. CA047B]|uniref:tail fiber domain-containing protein n=1 Tax=Corallococcus sp. CA047B TaxID=2316729 RepID=UPI000EA2975F|nr:tail fiber domain-containing protein [Corallococcus sp. CA047B]RKH08994.1 tail fiber domain-containing protein [Corallococcus sp. CA047B]